MKEYTLPEALKYLAENPGKELIDEDGDRVRLWIYENRKKITFQWFIPAQDCWADIEAVEAPFRHPEPKPEPVTLENLGRFRRVTVEWPEWVAVTQKKENFSYDIFGRGWTLYSIELIDLALRMGLTVTGEVSE